ncbi:unnamed protein product [Larinioides sclopetarius]|uniref:Macro domain-containing protein n=1 Tax=Larinioides sclopetarius TaxID=280406 RepID=A0AAV2ALZ1_9ARAC
MFVRAVTKPELDDLVARVANCINSGALGAGCTASIELDERHAYENLITNSVMGNLYESYAKKLGLDLLFYKGNLLSDVQSELIYSKFYLQIV